MLVFCGVAILLTLQISWDVKLSELQQNLLHLKDYDVMIRGKANSTKIPHTAIQSKKYSKILGPRLPALVYT